MRPEINFVINDSIKNHIRSIAVKVSVNEFRNRIWIHGCTISLHLMSIYYNLYIKYESYPIGYDFIISVETSSTLSY